MLRKFIDVHDCSIKSVQSCHRQISSSLIAECLKNDFRFSSSHTSTPSDIVYKVRKEFEVNVSYYKAWRMCSLKGDARESYALIPKFLMKLEERNPGLFSWFKLIIEVA